MKSTMIVKVQVNRKDNSLKIIDYLKQRNKNVLQSCFTWITDIQIEGMITYHKGCKEDVIVRFLYGKANSYKLKMKIMILKTFTKKRRKCIVIK
jgi:hypothetical protein